MKKRNILIIAGVVVIAAIIYALLNFGQVMDLGMKMTSGVKARDAANEQADFTVKADALSSEFKAGLEAANAKYLDKTILVEGTVTDVQPPVVSLGNVACTLDSAQATKAAGLKVGDNVKIQGRFVGYNELLDELDLSNCGIK